MPLEDWAMKEILKVIAIPAALAVLSFALLVQAQQSGSVIQGQSTQPPSTDSGAVQDPGVRADAVDAGQPLASLSAAQLAFFRDGMARFMQTDSVTGSISGEPGLGLGPSFNSNSCASCHAQPAVGGSSPSVTAYPNIGPNPQMQVAIDAGARNSLPNFIAADGPVREARFPYVVS